LRHEAIFEFIHGITHVASVNVSNINDVISSASAYSVGMYSSSTYLSVTFVMGYIWVKAADSTERSAPNAENIVTNLVCARFCVGTQSHNYSQL